MTTTLKFIWSTTSKFNNCLDLNHPQWVCTQVSWTLWDVSEQLPLSPVLPVIFCLKRLNAMKTDCSWVCFCSLIKLKAAAFWTRFCVSHLFHLLFLILHLFTVGDPASADYDVSSQCAASGQESALWYVSYWTTDSEKVLNSSRGSNVMTHTQTIHQELLQKS